MQTLVTVSQDLQQTVAAQEDGMAALARKLTSQIARTEQVTHYDRTRCAYSKVRLRYRLRTARL